MEKRISSSIIVMIIVVLSTVLSIFYTSLEESPSAVTTKGSLTLSVELKENKKIFSIARIRNQDQ